jgi:hypothetical protein
MQLRHATKFKKEFLNGRSTLGVKAQARSNLLISTDLSGLTFKLPSLSKWSSVVAVKKCLDLLLN